ncbi:MAG: hypothetical protein IKQ58_01360 [Prevotella sp.]|nr:hypothetical protein [Prevotella sp.]
MKKYFFALLAGLLMIACSSDDTEVSEPSPSVPSIEPQDYRDTLTEVSKEAAKRLVGKWKEAYEGWSVMRMEKVIEPTRYLQWYEDGRLKWYTDSLSWDSTLEAEYLKENGFKGFGYRVCNDWEFNKDSQKLSGHIMRQLIDLDGNFLEDGPPYYCQFGGSDKSELFVIVDLGDDMNCFGIGHGYIRVK